MHLFSELKSLFLSLLNWWIIHKMHVFNKIRTRISLFETLVVFESFGNWKTHIFLLLSQKKLSYCEVRIRTQIIAKISFKRDRVKRAPTLPQAPPSAAKLPQAPPQLLQTPPSAPNAPKSGGAWGRCGGARGRSGALGGVVGALGGVAAKRPQNSPKCPQNSPKRRHAPPSAPKRLQAFV